MNRWIIYISWFMLALAVAAWAGVVYGSLWLKDEAQVRGSRAQTVDQRTDEAAQAARLRAFVTETGPDRTRLDELTRSDIVAIATSIEQAGDEIGVDARVSTAIPSGIATEIPGGDSLQRIAFIVQAEGTFSGVVQLVRVLGSFPGFSEIDQFELERVPTAETASRAWRTSLRLQIYTTSDISS